MSAGSAAHNASKTALTRAAASSPPPSGTHIYATLLNATLQRLTVAGRPSPLTPETLKAFPDRMRAADGRNAGGQSGVRRDQRDGWNAGSSLPLFAGGADGGGADGGGPAEGLDAAGGLTAADRPKRWTRRAAQRHEARWRSAAAGAARTCSRSRPAGWRPFPWTYPESGHLRVRGAIGCGSNNAMD